MKTVYAFDYETRRYIGPVELDESDLSPLEEGVYLLPGNTTEAVPPELDLNTRRCFWRDGAWVLEAIPVIEPPTIEERRAALVAAVTDKRWEVETGGITLPTGTRVLTGKSDQNRITSVIVNAEIAGIQSVDFKSDSGWVTLSIGEIKGIAAATGAHVQACFTAERMHHEAIAALDAAGIETYDINTGWPVAAPNPQEH
ncbi:DUF4376 domain-containing protein [Variovorax sp. CAN2819]|uniref:DUF4376 domain-containing protein n=1 Tax=Variovorax sp. CAN15 TaxID=3046727 RepID=UPI0026478FAC|nr:DUF4376 domain-containing protein [Variovorax sp. CAN15]MDN6885275.1 DUF4376 domain-containing protein [Variovorax sp. CAN15]